MGYIANNTPYDQWTNSTQPYGPITNATVMIYDSDSGHFIPESLETHVHDTRDDTATLRLQGMIVYQVTRFGFGTLIREIAKQIPKHPDPNLAVRWQEYGHMFIACLYVFMYRYDHDIITLHA